LNLHPSPSFGHVGFGFAFNIIDLLLFLLQFKLYVAMDKMFFGKGSIPSYAYHEKLDSK
jgi:hypothetical protein